MAPVSQPVPFDSLRLLVFDLDGTLIDSKDDLVASVNAMLRHLGQPELPAEVVASYVGDGAPMLIRRALGVAPPRHHPSGIHQLASTPRSLPAGGRQGEFERGLEFFLGYYREHKLDRTRLFPGVASALESLAARRPLAVLTNKPVRPSREILEGLGVARFFTNIYGGNSFATKKPDPEGLLQLVSEHGIQPRQAIMIGDSAIDVRTGRNAGVWTCGVTYGFASHEFELEPPDWEIDSLEELTRALGC